MKTKLKTILIHSTPEKVFAQMDDFSKTGMHMSQSSMMMGSKLKLEQSSSNTTGVGATYHWYGKMMGMTWISAKQLLNGNHQKSKNGKQLAKQK